ncbi:MAG: hypothetical protein FWD73_05405 [Polyangiaceae bacterium]|nr:hypothetical protein [Polyangiaceae bacterium]
MRSFRIAFVGLPLAALLLAKDGHTIVWAGICRREAIGTRRLLRVLGHPRVAIMPDLSNPELRRAVQSLSPDLIVSWFWTKNVPASFRAIAPHGAIGVHPSLLPRHRGPNPFFWTIDCGDEVAGVTAHVLEDEYDTGAMLGQRSLRIEATWNAWTLATKLDRPSLMLLREVVASYANGEPPEPGFQNEALATLAPEPSDDDLELRWTDSSAAIARRVRAASPWPGAFTAIGDEILVLRRVRLACDFPRSLLPGQAFVRKDNVAVVRTGDGAVELLGARFDGDDEPELDASEIAEIVHAARELGSLA